MTIIAAKYNRRAHAADSLLCVGLDSRLSQLPAQFQRSDTPQLDFNRWIIDQTHPYVSAYKPNIAFYEARGDAGLRELKQTIDYLRANYPTSGIVMLRADIGSTNDGYVEALFDWRRRRVTLNPIWGRSPPSFLARADSLLSSPHVHPGAGNTGLGKANHSGRSSPSVSAMSGILRAIVCSSSVQPTPPKCSASG
jgi:orotidine-5'-phosphate decarboxylase